MKTSRFGTITGIAVVFIFHLAARPSSGSWNSAASPTTAFASFNSTVEASGSNAVGFFRPNQLDVFAQQVSSISPNDFEAMGTAHIIVEMSSNCCSSGSTGIVADAASAFDVGFTLLEPPADYYHLSFRIQTSPFQIHDLPEHYADNPVLNATA